MISATMQLRCVKCSGSNVALNGDAWVCPDCAARFEIVRGVARFVDSQAYTGSFGFEWNHFAKSQLDSANGTTRSRDAFVEKTGFALEELRGRRILDAGCGMGRFAEVVAAAGAEVQAQSLSCLKQIPWLPSPARRQPLIPRRHVEHRMLNHV
jgi:hypothetical protein